jgi:hypothetical protein
MQYMCTIFSTRASLLELTCFESAILAAIVVRAVIRNELSECMDENASHE